MLTPAEWAVVEFVRHGLTNRAIAERQGLSGDAVKFHVGNALAKVGMASRQELRRRPGINATSAVAKGDSMSHEPFIIGLGQMARTVPDIEAATSWYRDTLGLTHLYSFGDLAFFDLAGTRLYLQNGEPGAESILYLQVGDIQAAHRALTDKGVAFESAPHMGHRHDDGTEEWLAVFPDPERRQLALIAQAKP